jgi:hypothetical protein
METHIVGGWNNLAFSGSRENVSFLTKFLKLDMIDSLSSWLRQNHFKVENLESFMKLS